MPVAGTTLQDCPPLLYLCYTVRRWPSPRVAARHTTHYESAGDRAALAAGALDLPDGRHMPRCELRGAGFGRLWAWDPVRNAALLPWLRPRLNPFNMFAERAGSACLEPPLLVLTFWLTLSASYAAQAWWPAFILTHPALGACALCPAGACGGLALIVLRARSLPTDGRVPTGHRDSPPVHNVLFGHQLIVLLVPSSLSVEAVSCGRERARPGQPRRGSDLVELRS